MQEWGGRWEGSGSGGFRRGGAGESGRMPFFYFQSRHRVWNRVGKAEVWICCVLWIQSQCVVYLSTDRIVHRYSTKVGTGALLRDAACQTGVPVTGL